MPQVDQDQFTQNSFFDQIDQSEEEPIRLRKEIKEKAQSSPIKEYRPMDENDSDEAISQEEDREEEYMVEGSDDSNSNSNSCCSDDHDNLLDLDGESDDEEEAEKKRKENEEILAWAKANGF